MVAVSKKRSYIVATTKPWNIALFHKYVPELEGNWYLVTDVDQLTKEYVEGIDPKYIFFPHWSWIVPKSVTDNFDCVCFHMTDVPYGRGGSPLQNLIVRGHQTTRLTALKMSPELDAGDVYYKRELSLQGSAQEIYQNASELCYKLMVLIADNDPETVVQQGEVTMFQRRTPEQSEIKSDITPARLYDQIRMLDAESYPHAYLIVGQYKLEFTAADIDGDEVSAKVAFRRLIQDE